MRKITVGTRDSKLAVQQTKWVIKALQEVGINNEFEIEYISTKGDRVQNAPISAVGRKGIFSTEIEGLLSERKIDFAVHSLKDLPVTLDKSLVIASIPDREDPRDALINREGIHLKDLPSGSIIGTSSSRRAALIKAVRPDLKTDWIRGPVNSRLEQLDSGKYDAILLAVAGLNRLGLSDIITEYLPVDTFLPAVGQGALSIQCRKDDLELYNILRKINKEDIEIATITERALLRILDDQDETPIGAYASVENGTITLHVSVSSIDGAQTLFETATGKDALEVAKDAANKLKEKGVNELIEAAKKES